MPFREDAGYRLPKAAFPLMASLFGLAVSLVKLLSWLKKRYLRVKDKNC
jgi:hypothetical protein